MKKFVAVSERVIFFISMITLGYMQGKQFSPFVTGNFYNLPSVLFLIFWALTIGMIVEKFFRTKKKDRDEKVLEIIKKCFRMVLAFSIGFMATCVPYILKYEVINFHHIGHFFVIVVVTASLIGLRKRPYKGVVKCHSDIDH